MSGSVGFAVAGYQLVERMALGEFGVELTAEFARVTGARGIETMDKGWINVFHEKYLLGKGGDVFARFVRPSCFRPRDVCVLDDAFLLQGPRRVKAAIVRV
jgi:hypothetical protein